MEQSSKKVCIATFFGSENYGSNLQAIGLEKTITRMGYDVYFCGKFRAPFFYIRHPLLIYSRIFNKLYKKQRQSFFQPVEYVLTDERKERLTSFKIDNFRVLAIPDDKAWCNLISQKPIYVAGSDIIWNPYRGYPANMFLDFAYFAGLRRASYASSIGAQELPKKYYAAYRRYLSSMSAIGVREQPAADMLSKIIHRKVEKVLDPSLLLNSQEWSLFADRAHVSVPVSQEGYCLCYFVMEDARYWEYVRKLYQKTHMQIIVLPMHKLDEEQPYSVIFDGTPYEFVWLIKHASLICTDSFHACAFSLQYEKEFYLLKRSRKAEDDKYNDLLTRYKITDRRVENELEFVRKPNPDYAYARKMLELDRKDSMDFLKRALGE